jgi:hypothetical protein
MEFKSQYQNMKMKKPPSEANPGKGGWENNAGALVTQKIREPMDKNRIEP